MRGVSFAALIALLAAGAASALSEKIDTDGDGLASLAEIQAAYPDVSEDLFAETDLDGDGYIDDEEMAAAVTAELLPASEGD